MKVLLNWLLAHVLFAGTMFFAAGTTIGDVTAGGGDGAGSNGDEGSSGGSGDSHGDSGGNGSGEDGAGADEGLGGENDGRLDGGEEGGSGGDPNALVDSGDGRKIPQKYAELFKNDKALRETYFSQQALKKTFPGGVKEAIELAKTVEEFGGVEAFETVKTELDGYHADAELFQKDQGKWIESSFKEDPDASLKAFTHSLDYVGEHHPEHYDHLMAKVILNDLNSSLPVRDMYDLLAGLKDNPKAQELATKLAGYYNGRKNLAAKIPEKQIDPQQKQLDARNEKLTKKENEIRNKTINAEVGPYMNRTIESTLTTAAKAAGFDLAKLQKDQPNRYARFLKDVRATIHAEVLGDDKWLDRYSKALASNDTEKCKRMMNARHDQAIKGTDSKAGVVAPVFHEWFGPPKAGVRPRNDGAGGSGSRSTSTVTRPSGGGRETPMVVNSLPAPKEINYNDPVTDKWAGIYRLKTGKLIQVKR